MPCIKSGPPQVHDVEHRDRFLECLYHRFCAKDEIAEVLLDGARLSNIPAVDANLYSQGSEKFLMWCSCAQLFEVWAEEGGRGGSPPCHKPAKHLALSMVHGRRSQNVSRRR